MIENAEDAYNVALAYTDADVESVSDILEEIEKVASTGELYGTFRIPCSKIATLRKLGFNIELVSPTSCLDPSIDLYWCDISWDFC